jgi:hypothetical protein
MSEPIIITSDDPILQSLNFKPYRSIVARRAVRFEPADGEPQTMEVTTPWGSPLTAKAGDMLVSEMDNPDDVWPVDARIFDDTYEFIRPGVCIKRAVTLLVPMVEVTNGDEDQLVTVQTLEGPETVRAGDFYLAKGVRGEIWAYSRRKADSKMIPVE